MRANYQMQRLFFDAPLGGGVILETDSKQAHYLLNVLRLGAGAEILVFNGRDGEWRATLQPQGRKNVALLVTGLEREQTLATDLVFCFAPLKVGRLDYLVQKAVEMGAGIIRPVITRHTRMQKVGTKRLHTNIIEAAEQCGVLTLPSLKEPEKLERLLAGWDHDRVLIFCDEAAAGDNPLEILMPLKGRPLGLLVGPEGGFSSDERLMLRALPFVTAIPLGPRILRADTAAVAALAVVQAAIGDW